MGSLGGASMARISRRSERAQLAFARRRASRAVDRGSLLSARAAQFEIFWFRIGKISISSELRCSVFGSNFYKDQNEIYEPLPMYFHRNIPPDASRMCMVAKQASSGDFGGAQHSGRP